MKKSVPFFLSMSVFISLSFLFSFALSANESLASSDPSAPSDLSKPIKFEKPKVFDFITNVPSTLVSAWKMSFNTKPETLMVWGGVISSTIITFIWDEEILAEVKRWGRDLGLGNDDKTTTMIRKNNISLMRGPTDAGSAMYFLGDGWMHTFIGTGFLLSGLGMNDNRAIQTGSQIYHGMISSTIINQIFKRSFGRESPYRKTKYRGDWNFFPSFSTYNNDTSKHDAMPTGHLMVTSMTFTVIYENYPDYRSFVVPIAATWMTLLGLQMVNNGVHWISDYPLGMAMGYVFGKVSSKYGRIGNTNTNANANTNSKKSFLENWEILPVYISEEGERSYGLYARASFF
ncbi:MAG: phosphatase PAP2 family protein [Oligoflexia bacterium]|nr:phosphatase PAP2 family protein [Oligoflexia bacterium]